MNNIEPLVSEICILMHTVGGLVPESELNRIIPKYWEFRSKLEGLTMGNARLIDRCPAICSHHEVLEVDELIDVFRSARRDLPKTEVVTRTLDRLYVLRGEIVREVV